MLSGTIENFANRVVELLLVSDSGEVKNLSYFAESQAPNFPVVLDRDAAQRWRRWSATGAGRDDAAGSRFVAAGPNRWPLTRSSCRAVGEAQRNNVAIAAAARIFALRTENRCCCGQHTG